jgi:hypothetical protein
MTYWPSCLVPKLDSNSHIKSLIYISKNNCCWIFTRFFTHAQFVLAMDNAPTHTISTNRMIGEDHPIKSPQGGACGLWGSSVFALLNREGRPG